MVKTMKNPEDKMVKILLSSGTVVHLYSPPEAMAELFSHPSFIRFKDDANDYVMVSINNIAGFEVLDDRRDSNPTTATELKTDSSEGPVQTLPLPTFD